MTHAPACVIITICPYAPVDRYTELINVYQPKVRNYARIPSAAQCPLCDNQGEEYPNNMFYNIYPIIAAYNLIYLAS